MTPSTSLHVDLEGPEAFRAFSPAARALRGWLANGGDPASAPDPRYRGVHIYGDAASIVLDAAELACLDVITGCDAALTVPADLEPARRRSEIAADLLERGVLVMGEVGPVIAPTWFGTLGVALLGPRATRIAWREVPVWAELSVVRAGGRAVIVESVGAGRYRISAALPQEARDRLEAALGLDGYAGAVLETTPRMSITEAALLEAARWVDDRRLPEPSPDLQDYVRIADGPEQWRRDVRDDWALPGEAPASAWGHLTGGSSGLWLEARESPSDETVFVQRLTLSDARDYTRALLGEPGRARTLWEASRPPGPRFVGSGEAPHAAFFGGLRQWWWLVVVVLVVVGGGLVVASQQTGNPIFALLALVVLGPPVVGLYVVLRWSDYLLPRSRPRTFTSRASEPGEGHQQQERRR